MKTYLKNNGSKNLIVFFCGWALDEKPFALLQSKDFDVLFVFDYSDLKLNFDFSKYEKKILIAFSYGVFIASICKLPDFDFKIAINGTLKPINKDFGIAPKIFDLTLNSINEESMQKFYSRMFDNDFDYKYFTENLPQREAESCKTELLNIKKYYENSNNIDFSYDKVLISDGDKIVSVKSQLNFWQDVSVKNINAGHFIFYKFKSFDEIMNL